MSAKTLSIDIALARHAFDLTVKRDIPMHGVTAVFGPSGAGKSSLLRAIAGFDTPQTGRLKIGEAIVFDSGENIDTPPHRRGVGYMFQDARLFSHLDVKGNLEFAQKRAPSGGASLAHIISAFDLGGLLLKNIATLSGGERQRVAMARTVLSQPELLLLDEPLAALDRARKAELLPFIRMLADEFKMAVVFVSHDLVDVGTLADRILCLREGQVSAYGEAIEILPKLQTGDEMQNDLSAWYDAKITFCDTDHHAATLGLSADHKLIVPLTAAMKTGDKCRLAIRADDVSIALSVPDNISIQNKLDARVKSIEQDGARVIVRLYLPDVDTILPDLYALITPLAQSALKLEAGQSVIALVKSVSLAR